jgi:hypothetical protein
MCLLLAVADEDIDPKRREGRINRREWLGGPPLPFGVEFLKHRSRETKPQAEGHRWDSWVQSTEIRACQSHGHVTFSPATDF